MDYSITKKRDYAWMSQASNLDFQGLLAGNEESLRLKLEDSPINAAKIFADEQINTLFDKPNRNITSIYNAFRKRLNYD